MHKAQFRLLFKWIFSWACVLYDQSSVEHGCTILVKQSVTTYPAKTQPRLEKNHSGELKPMMPTPLNLSRPSWKHKQLGLSHHYQQQHKNRLTNSIIHTISVLPTPFFVAFLVDEIMSSPFSMMPRYNMLECCYILFLMSLHHTDYSLVVMAPCRFENLVEHWVMSVQFIITTFICSRPTQMYWNNKLFPV